MLIVRGECARDAHVVMFDGRIHWVSGMRAGPAPD